MPNPNGSFFQLAHSSVEQDVERHGALGAVTDAIQQVTDITDKARQLEQRKKGQDPVRDQTFANLYLLEGDLLKDGKKLTSSHADVKAFTPSL